MEISSILFGLAVFFGHSIFVIFSHNRFYGLPLSHKTTDAIQFVHFLWLILVPPFLFSSWSGQLPGPAAPDPLWLQAVMVICCLVALVGFPLDLFFRATRRGQETPKTTSSQEVFESSQARLAGWEGPGIRGWMCKIPGNLSLRPRLHRYEATINGLPGEWDGLTILHLSDLHVQKNPTPEFFSAFARELGKLRPDVIAFTGDLVEKGGADHAQVFHDFLQELTFQEVGLAILGNHDFWHPIEPTLTVLEKHGYQRLGNHRRKVTIRGRPMAVWGLEYPWNTEFPEGWNEPHSEWTLCLSHTPDHFPRFARQGPGMMLAGHVHGGQICLPIVGPVIMPSVYGRRYDRGWFRKGKALLHVSEGLSGGHPLRFGLHPAAALITLKAG